MENTDVKTRARAKAARPCPQRPAFFRTQVSLMGLITALGAVVAICALLGFGGRFGWALNLFAHFRVQYGLVLSLAALILYTARRHACATIFVGFALLNAAVIAPLYIGTPPALTSASAPLRLMQLNVSAQNTDYTRVIRVIEQYDPDVILLEEVNARWLEALRPLQQTHPHTLSKPRNDSFGIALFSKIPFAKAEIVTFGRGQTPSIIADLVAVQGVFTLIGIHPPPPLEAALTALRDDQLADLATRIQHTHAPVLVLGDFNATPWSYPFRRLLQTTGLQDSSQGHGVQATWPTSNVVLRIPIDHCLYSPGIQVVEKRIGPHVGSDHYPVIVDIRVDPEKLLSGL